MKNKRLAPWGEDESFILSILNRTLFIERRPVFIR